MAYQTGTASSAADLATAIRTFAQANGWSNVSQILGKNGCHVRITAPTETELKIEGSRNGTFVAPDLCEKYSRISLNPWPGVVTYHMVAFDSPETIWVTINYGITDHAHLGFGNLAKYGNWTGGMWFHGQHTNWGSNGNLYMTLDGMNRTGAGESGAVGCGLFWSQRDYTPFGNPSRNKTSFVHCELRGEVWPAARGDGGSAYSGDLEIIHCPTVINPIHRYSPNAFNGQTILTPFHLFLQNTDGHYMPIGHVDHVRFLKLTNYNPGDVIEIGPDRWKVFPWLRLDPINPDGKVPDGGGLNFSTGVLGVAVRYDGV